MTKNGRPGNITENRKLRKAGPIKLLWTLGLTLDLRMTFMILIRKTKTLITELNLNGPRELQSGNWAKLVLAISGPVGLGPTAEHSWALNRLLVLLVLLAVPGRRTELNRPPGSPATLTTELSFQSSRTQLNTGWSRETQYARQNLWKLKLGVWGRKGGSNLLHGWGRSRRKF
jgi:hypothetical protein